MGRGTGKLAVVHCIAPGAIGGLESVVRALAEGMLARQHDVHVAAVVEERNGEHPYVAELRRAGVPVTGIILPGRAYLREFRELSQLLAERRPTVVHTHGYRSDVLAGTVARRRGLPTVTTVHGFTGGDGKNRLYERLQRWAFRRFDAVVAVSRPLEAMLLDDGVRRERLHLLRNAVAPVADPLPRDAARRALGLPEEGVRIGWVGRLSREKGADVMVEAMARLQDRATLSFVGDGPLRERGAARAAELGLGETIHWHGTVMGAARLLRAFDVVVLSSRTEGTPIVLLEAMQCGVPVVATAVGGVPDVLTVAEGWLVPSGNPEALASAVREAIDDADEAGRRAEAARSRLEREFAPGPWLDRYEEIYRAVTAPGNAT